MAGTCLLWLRRDLRLGDHPALAAAAAEAGDAGVVPVVVIDPRFRGAAGTARTEALRRALRALSDSLDGRLHLAAGDPVARLWPLGRTGVAPSELRAARAGVLCARHVPGIVKPGDCVAVLAVEVADASQLEGPGPRELEGVVP